MSKDIKVTLKEARDAINNKDFQTAMKASKSVLREDKANYMAIVFLGIALKEIGPSDQAPKAFKKAIELNSNHPLAWQGLANYYESLEDEEHKKELPQCYISLLKTETNDKKVVEYCQKLNNLSKFAKTPEICLSMFEASKKCTSDENKTLVINILTTLLEECSELTPELESCILELIKSNCITVKSYAYYLTMLNKDSRYEDLLENAKNMHHLFPNDLTSLTWTCKIYNQLFIEDNSLFEKVSNEIQTYINEILEKQPSDAMALFSQAVLKFQSNSLSESKENLVKVTAQRPGLLYAWIFLTDVNIRLNLYEDARQSWERGDKLLQSINYSKTVLKNKSDYQKLMILSKSDDPDDWKIALDLYNEVFHQDRGKYLPILIDIKIKAGKISEAKLLASELKSQHEELANLFLLRVLKLENKINDALELCDKFESTMVDWLLEKGLTYFTLNQNTKCLENLLKAAKFDPNNYLCFLYLGDYYKNVNNIDKARRCYEKSFKLNSKSSRVGIELSKIYRKSNPEANLALLKSLTNGRIDRNNQWAWLQLGLTHLEQDNPAQAIENLRLVLRVDPENLHCWESLADAYLARGAFTSALKCYQKVLEFSERELYSSLQVANIKKLLGEYADARADFESILLMNKHYAPALKGLAETTFNQAKQCFRDQRLGSAQDNAQLTVNNVILALKQRSDLSCLWKLLADACHFVAKLPEKHSCLYVLNRLLGKTDPETEVFLDKPELFDFAQKCYTYSIHFAKDDMFLWHDLATCYLNHAHNTLDPIKKGELLNNAMATAQHCTRLNSSCWQHWNLLGTIGISLEPPNYALAQHAYIKAVTVDPNSSVAWTNLGVLYLVKDEIKLANKAFSEGQRADPNYTNSWIGQAIIAELLSQDKEAMDLFRHSTQLDQHQQGSLGYGHWVCKFLLEGDPKDIQRSVYNLHGIPVACDVLKFYTAKNSDNACAWNILGLLNERLDLKLSARDAFKHAYQLSEKQHRDKAKTNYGRLLYKLEQYAESIEMFQECTEASFSSGSGLALALFRNGQYEDSYTAYEQALHWLTDEETHQSDLLVALACIAYKFQGADAAKTLLFQSIELKPRSLWSLYSTLALGLLHKDWQLAKLVFNELKSLNTQSFNDEELRDYVKNYSVLLAYFYVLNGAKRKAIMELSKLVHNYPNQASAWHTLSQILFITEKSEKKLCAAVICADAAMRLCQWNTDVSKMLCLASVVSFVSNFPKKAKILAQKAVHLCPDVREGWAVLILALSKVGDDVLPRNYSKNIRNYMERIRGNEDLLTWCQRRGTTV